MSQASLQFNPLTNPFTVPDWAELFPDSDLVSGGSDSEQAEAKEHLLPLIALDLSAFNPAWQGRLSVVGTVEPCDGTLGADGHAHYNDWVSENWLAFRLDDASRMHFLADWRYFDLVRIAPGGEPVHTMRHLRRELEHLTQRVPAELLQADAFTEYQYRRILQAAQFHDHAAAKAQASRRQGLLAPDEWASEAKRAADPQAFLDWLNEPRALAHVLGGPCDWDLHPFHTNCRSRVNDDDRDNQFPVTPDGRPAQFIGAFSTGHYGIIHDAETLVFYEPETRTVWQCFTWS